MLLGPPETGGIPSEGRAPTDARRVVILFAITLALISYTDRVVIAQAATNIERDLGLDRVKMGLVFGVFSCAYAAFELPGGWMGDRWGARTVLLRVVSFWSFFTAATGWVFSYASLLVCRFLFGVGEAGCFPNLTKMLTNWLPGSERVRAQGAIWFAARWGGAVTPFLVALLLRIVSWRWAFGIFGTLGLFWGLFFYSWYRDEPGDHPGVNAAELALIREGRAAPERPTATPWTLILKDRSILLLWLQFFLLSYGWWFYIQWLPTYIKEARGFALEKDALQGAVLSGLPLFFGGIGCFISGRIQPWLARRFKGEAPARQRLGLVSLGAAGLLIVLSVQLAEPVAAMMVLGLAGFCNDLAVPMCWAACMDRGGVHTGTVAGGMNMLGAGGGAVAGPAVGLILRFSQGNWDLPLYVAAAGYFVAALCWLFIDPVTPLSGRAEDEPEGASKES